MKYSLGKEDAEKPKKYYRAKITYPPYLRQFKLCQSYMNEGPQKKKRSKEERKESSKLSMTLQNEDP